MLSNKLVLSCFSASLILKENCKLPCVPTSFVLGPHHIHYNKILMHNHIHLSSHAIQIIVPNTKNCLSSLSTAEFPLKHSILSQRHKHSFGFGRDLLFPDRLSLSFPRLKMTSTNTSQTRATSEDGYSGVKVKQPRCSALTVTTILLFAKMTWKASILRSNH